MWKFLIELCVEGKYGFFVVDKGSEDDKVSCTHDITAARHFYTVEELFGWVEKNTFLNNTDYGIKGIFFEEDQVNGN